MECRPMALLTPNKELAPEQFLLHPLGTIIGCVALEGLVAEQLLPNAPHRQGANA